MNLKLNKTTYLDSLSAHEFEFSFSTKKAVELRKMQSKLDYIDDGYYFNDEIINSWDYGYNFNLNYDISIDKDDVIINISLTITNEVENNDFLSPYEIEHIDRITKLRDSKNHIRNDYFINVFNKMFKDLEIKNSIYLIKRYQLTMTAIYFSTYEL